MAVMSRKGWLLNLREGPTPYADAWALQKALIGARQREELADGLILLEHEPVFTSGRSARADHLRVPRQLLRRKRHAVSHIDRRERLTSPWPDRPGDTRTTTKRASNAAAMHAS